MMGYRGWGRSAPTSFGGYCTIAGGLALAGMLVLSEWVAPSPAGVPVSARAPDASSLIALGKQATDRARALTSAPVLRQVDVDPEIGRIVYRFTDAPATFEIAVTLPSPSSSPDHWQLSRQDVSKLVGHARPGLDLQTLRINPAEAMQALQSHWSGCAPRGLTLVGEGAALVWYPFCTLPDGRVAGGSSDGRSGAFRLSEAPPAMPPPTALPTG